MHDLMQICRYILIDLETDPHTDPEQEIGAEILYRILARIRIISYQHRDRPPCVRTFRMVREDREENICIKPAQLAVRRQINQIVCVQRDRFILMEDIKRGKEIFRGHMATLGPLHFGACVPRVHDKEDQQRDNSGEPAAGKELRQ